MKRLLPLAALLFAAPAFADDWPHWMGPKRDNTWREEGILEKFPTGGPKVLWRVPVKGGYAGPAVVNGVVYCTDFDSEKKDDGQGNFTRKSSKGMERVFAMDAKSGKLIWEQKYPVTYTVSYPAGPRCTPAVADGKVYFLGAEGNLLCCDAAKGDIVWKKDLREEYKTKSALWGYAGHPLIDGKKVIVLAGGKDSHIVAFDKETGKEIWKAGTSTEQGYCTPAIFEVNGVRQLVIPSPDAVRAHDPETGKEIWSTPYDASNGSIIMTPIRFGEHLFIGGYQAKNLMLKFNKDGKGVEVLWKDKAKLGVSPVNVQPYPEGDILYGYNDNGLMFGVSIPSGERLWETAQPVSERQVPSATAFIVKQGDRFFFVVDTGHLVIGKLSKTGFTELDRAKIIDPTDKAFGRDVVWCMPAFADKKLFMRNGKEMICVDLAK